MNTTAIADLVCSVFIVILYVRHFPERGFSRSNRLLSLCMAVMLGTLLIDAAAFTFLGPAYSLPFRFFINFLAFLASCVNVILFTYYEEALFSENAKSGPWLFRVIKGVEFVWLFCTAYEYFSGHLLSYDVNGVENLDYTFPAYILVLNLAIQLCLIAVTVINARRIGKDMAVLLCVFFIVPLLSSILFSFLQIDYTYALGSIMLGLVVEFVQKKQKQRMKQEQQKLLEETLLRQKMRLEQIKGLAGQFSVLYFVNLDTLETENYYLEESETPETAKSIDKKSENFFEAFRNSMVVYAHPDFKEEMLKYADPEFVRSLLKDRRRYDFRFLCMDATGGYSWTDMVIMKFSDHEDDVPVNIAVGYYNTDTEMKERLEVSRRMERDLEAIRGLANEFDTLHFVDLAEDTYSMYYLTEDSPDKAKELADESKRFSAFHKESMMTFCHPDHLEQMMKFADADYVREVLAKQKKYTCRFLCDSDSGYKWCEFSLIRLDREEIPQRIAVGYANIDAKVREEFKQQQIFAEHRSLLEYFVDQYWSACFIDLSNDTLEILRANNANASAYVMDGTHEDMDRFIDTHFHPDDKELMRKITDKDFIRGELKDRTSLSYIAREFIDGEEKIMRILIVRGADEDHVAVGFMDITEEVQEQRKHLLGTMPLSNDVLTKANIGMWAFELDEGQPPRMYDDETMLGLVGLDHPVPPEEAYHAWYDHIDPGSYDLVTDAVNKMISGEHAEVQYPWHFPDGRTIIVRCGGIRNFEYTKGIRIEGTHQDVTQTLHFDEQQRKREEQQRKDEIARIKAEASDKAKTEFLFNMSHDIRTPMNAILGYTDIALRHTDEIEKVDDSLKKIKMAGRHLLNLINDILEMSRIEAGVLEINNVPIDIRAAIDGIDLMSQTLAVSKSIDYRTVVGKVQNPYVYADELHINQIAINLISNAVKYTMRGGKVEYRIEQISEPVDGIARYQIVVQDTGIGMSEEFQSHLFENFSRENDNTVSKQEGAGLGLAIVKRITDLSGGTIRVQSEKGKGSIFTVELPFRVMTEDEIRKFNEEHARAEISGDLNLEGKRVLLAEDNELNREIASEILEEAGLLIETAEDGELAVKAVAEKGIEYYDFILMDIQMPVMNGYEATKVIRSLQNGDRIPIIALSANAFEEDKQKSLEAGMNAHVAKPIDIKELFGVLSKYVIV